MADIIKPVGMAFGIGQGWDIGNKTRQLVFKDRQLLIYPIISLIAAIVLFIVTFGFVFISGVTTSTGVYIAALIIFYILTGFVSTYVTAAMLLAFRAYQRGKKISIGESLSQTAPYATLLFEWAIVNLILVTIVRVIESRLRGVGRLVFGVGASLAITGITFFVIPIIIDERKEPFAALKESANMVVHNIGTSAVGLGVSELYSIALIILGILVIVVGIIAGSAIGAVGAIVLVAIGFVLIVFGALTASVIGQVFRFVLYEYINGNGLPAGITREDVQNIIPQYKGGRQTSGGGSGSKNQQVESNDDQ